MRAAQFVRYGGPEVLTLGIVPTPERLLPDQVRVRVAATSVNSIDIAVRKGQLRLLSGRRFPQSTGIDFVGTIEAVGEAVGGFAVGERVWGIHSDSGSSSKPAGTAAEVSVVAAATISAAPATVDDSGAASLIVAGVSAVTALEYIARVRAGETVLVRGATGGVGAAVVQLATALGARVVALTSAQNLELSRELGAVEAYDYASTAPAHIPRVDVIVDTVGTDMLRWRRRLRRNGRMVTTAFSSAEALIAIGVSTVFLRRRIRVFGGRPPQGRLAEVTKHVEAGRLRPVIHEHFTIDDIVEAHRAFERGGNRGKIVITLASGHL